MRRLQTFRLLHACSGCFRLERIAGWGLHPLESAALSRRTPEGDINSLSGPPHCDGDPRPLFAIISASQVFSHRHDFPWAGTAICFGDILSGEIVKVATITVAPFCAPTLVTCEV